MQHIKKAIKIMGIQAAVIIVLFAAGALMRGQGELIMPFLAGGFMYSVCWLSSGHKLLYCDRISPEKAKRSIMINFQLRLIMLFGTLWAAMQIGEPFFWAAVAGVFSMFAVMMLNAIVFSYQDKDML